MIEPAGGLAGLAPIVGVHWWSVLLLILFAVWVEDRRWQKRDPAVDEALRMIREAYGDDEEEIMTDWKRWCDEGDTSVETCDVVLASGEPGVAVRRSTDPGRYLLFTRAEWSAFLTMVRSTTDE